MDAQASEVVPPSLRERVQTSAKRLAIGNLTRLLHLCRAHLLISAQRINYSMISIIPRWPQICPFPVSPHRQLFRYSVTTISTISDKDCAAQTYISFHSPVRKVRSGKPFFPCRDARFIFFVRFRALSAQCWKNAAHSSFFP